MAEPIGVTSGLLTLAVFALQAGTTLYNTIQSFRSHPIHVRELVQELEALNAVLQALSETINSADINLSSLDLPLLRCGSACKDFQQELLKCSSRSNGARTSFRDWAKLRYMGDNIDGFRRLLAGYKSTISIALTDATLRKSSITAESLEDYRKLINSAHEDLQAHLESIDEKLEAVIGRAATDAGSDANDLNVIKEERSSALRCLQICDQLSRHIDQMQLTDEDSEPPLGIVDSDSTSERITKEGLEACKDSLTLTAARLEKHMKELTGRIVMKSKATLTSKEDADDLERLHEQWEAARQCIGYCSMAQKNFKENVSTVDNYGTGDNVQFLVSTSGQVIHGRNRGMGWRNRQVGGHLSDASVQQISRDLSAVVLQNPISDAAAPRSTSAPVPELKENTKAPDSPSYAANYGPGRTLRDKK